MVRCGQCSAVFNALEHLVEPTSSENAPGDDQEGAGGATSNYDLFGAAPDSDDAQNDVVAPVQEIPHSLLMREPAGRRGFPWLSLAGALLAGAALAVQAAWFYRDRIAVSFPESKPYLEAACAELGCRIMPPVDPQAISIESSDLQADQGNRAVLILTAILRNRAPFSQALPMLELSLTDAQDQAVARRVLKPAEYAPEAQASTIGAGNELQMRVFVDAGSLKANGYRLYAFYP